jgi:trimeric autotransporter adhesin
MNPLTQFPLFIFVVLKCWESLAALCFCLFNSQSDSIKEEKMNNWSKFGFIRFWLLIVLSITGISLFVLPPPTDLYAEPPSNPNPIPWVAIGTVQAVAPAGNVTYIGGDFSYVGPNTGASAAISLTTGDPKTPYSRILGEVTSVVPDGKGGWYIGGGFQNVCGVQRLGLAHILKDGSLDLTWNPGVEDGEVRALAMGGGVLYAGGSFTRIGGESKNYIAALNLTDGHATSWDPNANSGIWALAVSGTTVYAGGDFTSIGGQPRNYIAALEAATGSATAWNPNPNISARIFALSVKSGIVYAGGEFTNIGGQPRTNIAALDATTGLATSWSPNASHVVRALAISGGIVYAGGNFLTIGGKTRICIAALNATTGLATDWDPSADGGVYALAENNGIVYAGGDFQNIGGQRRMYIGALDAATGEATSWDPSTYARVWALSVNGDEIYAGGYFWSIGGKWRNFLAAINNVTGQVTSWNPDPSLYVNALTVSGGVVYAGGDFTFIGGQPRNYIAALDPSTGLATDWDPNANGSVSVLMKSGGIVYAGGYFTGIGGQPRNYIAALDPLTGLATDWDPNADGIVSALMESGGIIYAGGNFTGIGGQPRNYIAALDPSTGLATDWDPNADQSVLSLAESGGIIYAGGFFTNIGNAGRKFIAALDATTGAAVSNWDLQIQYSSSVVYALAVNNGVLYIGGIIEDIGGVRRRGLASVNAATGALTPWDPNVDWVHAIAVRQGTVYAGGNFNGAGPNTYPWGAYSQYSFAQFGHPFPRLAELLDFNNDTKPDLFWRNILTGESSIWYMNGASWNGNYSTISPPIKDADWILVGLYDFNGDGTPDFLWRNVTTGLATIWFMKWVNNALTWDTNADIVPDIKDPTWILVGAADFKDKNGIKDGVPDLLWRNTVTGKTVIWYMKWVNNALTWNTDAEINPSLTDPNWTLLGVVDFNKDGNPDLIWRNIVDGSTPIWYMDGPSWNGNYEYFWPFLNHPDWILVGVADFNRDGIPDLLWQNISNNPGDPNVWRTTIWYMNRPPNAPNVLWWNTDADIFPPLKDWSWTIMGR